METQAGFIKYILIIVAILAAVFLGQQALIRGIGKNVISGASDQVKIYMAKGSDWATSAIISPISGGVGQGKEALADGISQEKEKISENILKKVENYFSGIADSVMGKDNSGDCQAQQSTTESQADQ